MKFSIEKTNKELRCFPRYLWIALVSTKPLSLRLLADVKLGLKIPANLKHPWVQPGRLRCGQLPSGRGHSPGTRTSVSKTMNASGNLVTWLYHYSKCFCSVECGLFSFLQLSKNIYIIKTIWTEISKRRYSIGSSAFRAHERSQAKNMCSGLVLSLMLTYISYTICIWQGEKPNNIFFL